MNIEKQRDARMRKRLERRDDGVKRMIKCDIFFCKVTTADQSVLILQIFN